MSTRRLTGLHATAAIIVAGGNGTRMGEKTPKQFLELRGMPVVARTLCAYQAADSIDDIVVVIRPGDEDLYRAYKKQYGLTKLRAAVHGGKTRRESALRGFQATLPGTRYVAIADAARPLILPSQIDAVCLMAYRHGAAAAAHRVSDTVKRTDTGRKWVEKTLDRDRISLVQTPQVFSFNLYAAAALTAQSAGFEGTDDCSLVERIGHKIALVETGRFNLKITVPEDLAEADWILSQREE